MRITVLGYVVRGPTGGMAWHHLQYVLGLVRLGHDVRFVEDSDDYPACYDPTRYVIDTDPSYGLRFAADAFRRLGLEKIWSYHDAHTGNWLGPDARHAEEFCRSADMVLNLSGTNPLRDWTGGTPVRAYVDTDPAFTQIRHLKSPAANSLTAGHNAFLSFGENIPRGSARIPDDGFPWMATRQPIVLEQWRVVRPLPGALYTTVMQWESYRTLHHEGVTYGTKSASFEPYLGLPTLTSFPLEIALGSVDAPQERLRAHGWSIVDPLDVARTPWSYQSYIRQSRGELTVAKQGYVLSNAGWFSERSAAYLASGRPVVTQRTGFSTVLPVGAGLLEFSTPAEAVAALTEVESDYALHSRAARELAEQYFDSDLVLPRLLDDAVDQANA
ncbi:MAG: hypothetical protein M3Q09_04580 [Gemmatimonadota bacterium]|nr:hypothetical protein [Gemmatimonadota bacterium]